jgi:hypothetical protein
LISAVAAAVTSAVLAATGPSFVFGREGGNIRPTTTRIAASGKIAVDGQPDGTLTQAKLRELLQVAVAQRFFALPRKIACPATLPDFATLYVTVRDGTRIRTVTQHGNCNRRFVRVYAALRAAVKAAA